MAFKRFVNLRFFMTMRHICSWQYQFTSEMLGTEETPYGLCYHSGKISHLSNKLLLLGLLDSMLCKVDTQDPQERDQ